MNPGPHSDNPYTPPATEVMAPAAEPPPPPVPWPRSVRWAAVFFTLGLVGAFFSYILMKQVADRIEFDVPGLALGLVLVVKALPNALPLIGLLCLGRRPVAYWITVIALAWLCGSSLFILGSHIAHNASPEETGLKLVMLLNLGFDVLGCWIFYRVTLGRHSLLYFRIVKS
jgi:hypothetical protein